MTFEREMLLFLSSLSLYRSIHSHRKSRCRFGLIHHWRGANRQRAQSVCGRQMRRSRFLRRSGNVWIFLIINSSISSACALWLSKSVCECTRVHLAVSLGWSNVIICHLIVSRRLSPGSQRANRLVSHPGNESQCPGMNPQGESVRKVLQK